MENSSLPNSTHRHTILVIDDEEPVREAVKDILELVQIDVLQAADGSSGISIFKQNQHLIKLVLLDLSMPGLSGEETFYQLKQIDPDVRVLLSSGFNEADVSSRLIGKDISGFIQKPYTLDALIEKVNQHLH